MPNDNDYLNKLTKARNDGCHLADTIIEASLYWTGEDEERNPALKTARTLAGLFLGSYLHD